MIEEFTMYTILVTFNEEIPQSHLPQTNYLLNKTDSFYDFIVAFDIFKNLRISKSETTSAIETDNALFIKKFLSSQYFWQEKLSISSFITTYGSGCY